MYLHHEERGTGEPLLLLHGMLGSSGDFRHLFDLDELARSYRVVMPDLRGHGRSTLPSDGAFSQRQCADDVLELLDRLGIARCRAVGVSLGGNTLLHIATRAPERVEAMVLSGAVPYFPESARVLMRAMTESTHTAEEWDRLCTVHAGGAEQVRALLGCVRGLAERHDDMAFTPPLLATVAARTLLIDGDRDPLYPVERFVEMYRSMPHASLWIMPGGGHAPVFGEARAEVARIVLQFLRNSGAAPR